MGRLLPFISKGRSQARAVHKQGPFTSKGPEALGLWTLGGCTPKKLGRSLALPTAYSMGYIAMNRV